MSDTHTENDLELFELKDLYNAILQTDCKNGYEGIGSHNQPIYIAKLPDDVRHEILESLKEAISEKEAELADAYNKVKE